MVAICAGQFSGPGQGECLTKCKQRAEVYYWAVMAGGFVSYSCADPGFMSGLVDLAGFPLSRYASDSDLDLMPDDWEENVGLDPDRHDALGDPDDDHLPNLLEFIHDLNPRRGDTDGDGVNDLQEATNLQPR
jgi:hypothetical protein